MVAKEDRCWPGYEPVKGKKEHEQGSCKKKAESKSSPSEKKTQNARKKQLDQWSAEHPGSRRSAAQHLHAPGTKTKKAKKTTQPKATARKKKAASSK